MTPRLVLVVDDDADILALVAGLLRRAGYLVHEARDGRDALRRFHAERPELVVLDVSMPDLDGFQTLERIRDLSNVPVLMLTARIEELEMVRGLKSGADDYVTKPFRKQELLARVEAILRRRPDDDEAEIYTDPLLTVDFAERSVTANGRPVSLTPLEFKLLTALTRHPNQVLSRDQLLELVWGEWVSPEQVKNYVGYLRRKLGNPVAIETVRGFGYRYRPPSAGTAHGAA